MAFGSNFGDAGSVIYNPNVGKCQIVVGPSTSTSPVSFAINSSNQNTYWYGFNLNEYQCERCAGNYWYYITRFNCPGCTTSATGLIGVSLTALTVGYYYNNGDGFVYRIEYATSAPGGGTIIDLQNAASAGASCSGTCAI
jgi:hypothetical protein